MTTQIEKKEAVAKAAIKYIEDDFFVGVGTGSTADCFIAELGKIKSRIQGAVASSDATEKKLRELGIPIIPLDSVTQLDVYVDGADEATNHRHLIKGGGGALTREKITAAASKLFVCIASYLLDTIHLLFKSYGVTNCRRHAVLCEVNSRPCSTKY